jgi:GR25 family glycosyltransferase involved in LPS biosynthesis
MKSYNDLITRYKQAPGISSPQEGPVHATLAAYPGNDRVLELVVKSLLGQVNTLHIFLENFTDVPGFLDHEKIFLTRSQDFGPLGECGKYYWSDDLKGYHFVCSDKLVYPGNCVEELIRKIEEHGRKAVIGAGGARLTAPFRSFRESAELFKETDEIQEDTQLPLLGDLALAYHSDTLKVSRHFFYQPELSDFWFSILALEQNVPMICMAHKAGWLVPSGQAGPQLAEGPELDIYRDLLVRSYFNSAGNEQEKASYRFNDYFDRAYVMNLDRRPDRWQKISRIAEKHELVFTRFPAVDGSGDKVKSQWEEYAQKPLATLPDGIEPLTDYRDKFLKYRHYQARIQFMESKLNRKAVQSPGALGYALSYISILKEAIRNGYTRIMIFDDDIVLHKSFNEEFEKHARMLPGDWKLIMLGAMQHRWEPYITRSGDLFYHCHGSSVASHAVGIDRKVFLQVLYYAEKLDLPIDEGAVFHIQNVYASQCYIFLPNLAIQDLTESDISSSAMKKEDTLDWIRKFRWETDNYDD